MERFPRSTLYYRFVPVTNAVVDLYPLVLSPRGLRSLFIQLCSSFHAATAPSTMQAQIWVAGVWIVSTS